MDAECMDALPDDILAEFFSHISFVEQASASRVCKRWRALLQSPAHRGVVVKRIDLEHHMHPGLEHVALAVVPSASGLRELALSVEFDCGAVLDLAAKYCPLLETIAVAGRTVKDRSLARQLASWPRLRSLSVHPAPAVGDESLIALARHCTRLEALCISYTGNVTDAGVEAAARGLPRLRRVRLKLCGGVGGAALEALARHCPLAAVDWNYSGVGLSDAALRALQGCVQLETLRVLGSPEVTEGALAGLAAACPRLARLKLYEMPLLADFALLALARHAPGLSALGLRRLPATDVGACALASGCPRLERLDLGHLPGVTAAALAAFARHARGALADLRLAACGPGAAAAAAPLLRRSPRLARLRILDAPDLASADAEALAAALAAGPAPPRLARPHARARRHDAAAAAAARLCPRLCLLALRGTRATPPGAAALKAAYPRLLVARSSAPSDPALSKRLA
eukprot:tig00021493_g21854.t1